MKKQQLDKSNEGVAYIVTALIQIAEPWAVANKWRQIPDAEDHLLESQLKGALHGTSGGGREVAQPPGKRALVNLLSVAAGKVPLIRCCAPLHGSARFLIPLLLCHLRWNCMLPGHTTGDPCILWAWSRQCQLRKGLLVDLLSSKIKGEGGGDHLQLSAGINQPLTVASELLLCRVSCCIQGRRARRSRLLTSGGVLCWVYEHSMDYLWQASAEKRPVGS